MCRTEVDLTENDEGERGNEANLNTNVPCQQLLLRLKRVSVDPTLTFQDYAKYITQYSIMLNRLQLMRVVTQDQREAFLSEVRSAVRKRINKVDILEQVPDIEHVLMQLRERQITGEAEIRVLRKRASELLPFRRGVPTGSQPPSDTRPCHPVQRRSDLLGQHWTEHAPRGTRTAAESCASHPASPLSLPGFSSAAGRFIPRRGVSTMPLSRSDALRAQFL